MTKKDNKQKQSSGTQNDQTNPPSPAAIRPRWLKEINKTWRVEASFPNLDLVLSPHSEPDFHNKGVIIALDSSVILSPYDISNSSFKSIINIYRSLKAADRLVVPARAVREFAKRRDALLANLMGRLAAQEQSAEPPWLEYPFLEHVASFKKLEDAHQGVKASYKNYNKALADLVDRIGKWRGNDPVTLEYQILFDHSVVFEPNFNQNDLERIWKQRLDANIPPGYIDGNKKDNGIGDFIIWISLIEKSRNTNKDIIFVINDAKEDWFHRSGSKKIPRPELIHEFRNSTNGHRIAIIDLPSLLKGFGASRQDIENAEAARARFVSREGRRNKFVDSIEKQNLENNDEQWQIDYETASSPSKVRYEARILARRYGGMIIGDQNQTIRLIFNADNLPSDDDKRQFKQLRAYLLRSGEGWIDPDQVDPFS